jgi:hypothetical protein
MAIVQAVLALISRSLGSILSALFGWAVVALFGQTSPREKAWLQGLKRKGEPMSHRLSLFPRRSPARVEAVSDSGGPLAGPRAS